MDKKSLLKAARNIQKNVNKKKRPASDVTAKNPAAKKKKTSSNRSIPLLPEDLVVLSRNLGCTRFLCPLTGNSGLFSALTMEEMLVYSYPVLLEAPEAKGKRKTHSKMICGVSKPELVFSVLQKTFADLHSDLSAHQIADWEPYRWNVAYYGQGIVSRAQPWSDLVEKIQELRPFGGNKNPTLVNIFNEVRTSKAKKAVDVSFSFSGETPVPKTLSRQWLEEFQEQARELAASEKDLLKSDVSDRLDEVEEESDSEEESEHSSDDDDE